MWNILTTFAGKFVGTMTIPAIPMTINVLSSYLNGFMAPMQKILDMEQKGELVRLKRGLYITANGKPNLFLVANHLYGPSYVSCESALRYYGLIPEHVESVISVSTLRSKEFENALGHFSYRHIPMDYYPQDFCIQTEKEVSFQIASPEKALADLVILTAGVRLRYKKEILEYLEQDLRLDMDAFYKMDAGVFERLATVGKKRNALLNIAKILRDDNI